MTQISPADVLKSSFTDRLFPNNRQLIPDIDDFYEIALAFYESLLLDDSALLRNSAYFARVGSEFTRHFLMCMGESLRLPNHSSSRLRSFFEKNIFRTGYATHGLFPYRGKFHPQMIKGLLNVMGLRPGDTVLDPMMGSGTVPVEASLMGIHSIGIDASPFCRFMAQTKLDAMTMSLTRARQALGNSAEVYSYFKKMVGMSDHGRKARSPHPPNNSVVMEPPAEYVTANRPLNLTGKDKDTADTFCFLLLAYLDAAGYYERNERKNPEAQFHAILDRYLFVTEKIQRVLQGEELALGSATVQEGDARHLTIQDDSVEGVIFSPPYSFAIDYLDNDAFHLNYLGVDIAMLKERMIGLRGQSLPEKFALYREDMRQVLAECARVMKRRALCTIIVGTNSNQLSKALKQSPKEVPGLQQMFVDMAASYGLRLLRMLNRTIVGISNTMRREYIVILEKP